MGCWPLVLKILLLASLLLSVGAALANHYENIAVHAMGIRRARSDEDAMNAAEDVAEPSANTGSGGSPTAGANVLLIGYQPASLSAATESSVGAESAVSSTQQPVNYAELCYLSNGGSSLTLTINEATQVGSVVGSVEVNGNPAPDASGNVDLVDVLSPVSGGIVVTAAPQRASMLPNGSLEVGSEVNLDWSRRAGHLTRRRLLSRRSTDADSSLSDSTTTSSSASATSTGFNWLDSAAAAGPPVRLEPGTKNLVLVRPLDRELLDGEQSPVLQVSCVPRLRASLANPQEAATTIPVRLLVTDANDHAPEFVGLPYVVNVSETSHIGQVVSRNILATDRDSAGPFSTIHYRVLDDGHSQSQLLQFANPLEPVLVVAGPLDYESLASFTITLVAQDQGEPEPLSTSCQVQVNIVDFDDQNPRFLDDKYTLIMDESQRTLVGQNLKVLPRNLHAEDGDRGINAAIVYSFELAAGAGVLNQRLLAAKSGHQQQQQQHQLASRQSQQLDELKVDHYLHLNPSTGEVRLIRQWPSRWAGAPMTLVVRATQADNPDRYTLTTLTISGGGGGGGSQQPAPAASTESAREFAGAGSETVGAEAEAGAAANQQPAAAGGHLKQGIQFQNDWLNISVAESVPINEKVARVKAHLYLASQMKPHSLAETGAESELEAPVELVTGAADNKPISYQILDDQHDQWSINGLGEILVRRPLDYELRRHYNFLVLATYTKYSDICQVQVNVVNVNDNKPRFTQPHYTFHLTESRLRNNLIGSVQAHDADLNDSIHYSLVGGEHAHLFDISPHGGQISLKAGTKSLQTSPCQLIVQATDTLGSKPRYSHQARVQIQVAPHLLGPHVDLTQVAGSASSGGADTPVDLIHHDARLFNSRSLLQQRAPSSTDYRGAAHQQPVHRQAKDGSLVNHEQAAPTLHQQRSSVATVMSSMQHMLRGAGFLDMPWASALLLSALLAFMICLLLILIVTMTVHLYRRHSKAARQRQQLAAASNRIRHLNAGLPPPPPPTQGPHSGSSSSSSSRFLSHSSRGSGGADGGLNGGSSLGARLSISGTPQLHLSPSAGANMQHHQPISGHQTDYNSISSLTRQQHHQNRRAAPPPAPKDVAPQPISPGHHQQPLKVNIEAGSVPVQQISSLSSQSKRSYRSNSTDDSSVIHCGHYSVNSPHPQHALNSQAGGGASTVSFQLEPADSDHHHHQPQRQRGGKQLGQLQGAPGELAGCRAYRKLPHLGSLVRPARCRVEPLVESPIKRCSGDPSAAEESATQTDSAIVSDGSSSGVGGGGSKGGHLMALVRSADSRQPQVVGEPIADLFQAGDRIKWPPEAAPPQRVKRLTWDDQTDSAGRPEMNQDEVENSIMGEDEDCFIAPDIQLEGPISPLSNHQYPIQGTTDTRGHQYAEQHFLFSTPCSPVASNLSGVGVDQQPGPVHNQTTSTAALDSARDNCLDYTFVQSSQQFRLDTNLQKQHQQQSLSAQHHLLQLQLLQHHKNGFPNYLYSTASNRNNHHNPGDSPPAATKQALVRNQDLRLLTTAAI